MHTTPKHIIAVSPYVTNENGEAPGGQVEEGEPLDKAVGREILEENRR